MTQGIFSRLKVMIDYQTFTKISYYNKMSLMKGPFSAIIREKIIDGVGAPIPAYTPREIRLPRVPGKALALVGMRRTGKTTFLWQQIDEKVRSGSPREGSLYFSFEDERLAGLDRKSVV